MPYRLLLPVRRFTLSAIMGSISDRLEIGEEDVHVWFARFPPDAGAEREAWTVLSPEERARADRLRRYRDRALQIRTRAMVRRVLAIYLQTTPQDVPIAARADGKPALAGGDARRWPSFNVSHSGSVALMAVSASHGVGVDVEQIRADVVWREIADQFFSPAEVDAIGRIPRAERRRAFFDCWVRKEAYLKGLGVGLRRSTNDFTVPVVGVGGPVEDSGHESRAWYVYGLEVESGFAAAVAADGEVAVTLRPWPHSPFGESSDGLDRTT
jgi:4'-phosphopantetheinyl transferase